METEIVVRNHRSVHPVGVAGEGEGDFVGFVDQPEIRYLPANLPRPRCLPVKRRLQTTVIVYFNRVTRYDVIMPRPRNSRTIGYLPHVRYFKPAGIPVRMLTEEALLPDELEALRLHDVEGMDQTPASSQMGVSQPTFARILESAHTKVSRAIVKGYAIRIQSGKEETV